MIIDKDQEANKLRALADEEYSLSSRYTAKANKLLNKNGGNFTPMVKFYNAIAQKHSNRGTKLYRLAEDIYPEQLSRREFLQKAGVKYG